MKLLPAFASFVLALAVSKDKGEDGTCSSRIDCKEGAYFWPHNKGNWNLTGSADYAVPRDIRVETATWKWEDKQTDVLKLAPLIDGEKNLYLATSNGRVIKFSPDGKELWKHQTKYDVIITSPALMDGRLFYGTLEGFFVALDMKTGAIVWDTRISDATSGHDVQHVFAQKGVVVTATKVPSKHKVNNNVLVALNASNGRNLWMHRLKKMDTFNFQAIYPGDDSFIVMDTGGRLLRIDLKTGQQIFKFGRDIEDPEIYSQGGAVMGPNNVIYTVSNYGAHRHPTFVQAWKLDGTKVWEQKFKLSGNQAPAIGRIASVDGLSLIITEGEAQDAPLVMGLSEMIFENHLWAHQGEELFPMILAVSTGSFFLLSLLLPRRGVGKTVTYTLLGVFMAFFGCVVFLSTVHTLDLVLDGNPFWMQQFPKHSAHTAVLALDAETGKVHWKHDLPGNTARSDAGETENLWRRFINVVALRKPGLLACHHQAATSQPVITKDGTVYVGYQDGRLYSIRDDDGNGKLTGDEVKSSDFGHAFAASQSMAPGLFAAVPCGGGMYVWRK